MEKPETRFRGSTDYIYIIYYIYICLFESSWVSKIGCFFWNENFKSKEPMAFPNDGESTTLIPPGICEQKCLPSTFAYKRSFTMRCFRFPLLRHDVFGKLSRGLLTSNPDSAWCCPRQAPSAGQNRVIGMDRRSLLPCIGFLRHVSWGYQVSVVSQNTSSSLRRYTLQETNRHVNGYKFGKSARMSKTHNQNS